jgi:hypothetical protein
MDRTEGVKTDFSDMPAQSSCFTLTPQRWYAAGFRGDEFARADDYRSYSPIRVDSLVPMKSGKIAHSG